MDINKLDQELKNRFEESKLEIPFSVERKIDDALAELPASTVKKHKRFPKAVTYWLSGVACALFAVIMLSYFQSNPFSGTLSPDQSSDSGHFSYEEFPAMDSINLGSLLIDDFEYLPGDTLENVEIIHSIKQGERWIAMVRFEIEAYQTSFTKLIEIKKENGDYTANLLADSGNTVNQYDLYTHWYEESEGIGFGTVNDLSQYDYVEKVVIMTEAGNRLESTIHEDNYIYLSDSRPEKIQFLTAEGKVTQTMEAFNMDELFPLLSKEEGKYSLYVIGDEEAYTNFLDEGIDLDIARGTSTLESAINEYPVLEKLEIEQIPVYILFDHKGVIYKTYNFEELLQFVKQEK